MLTPVECHLNISQTWSHLKGHFPNSEKKPNILSHLPPSHIIKRKKMFFLPAIIEVDRSFNSSMIFLSASFENFPLISFPNLHFLAFLHPSVYLLLITHLTLLFFPSTYPSPYILPSPFSGISLAWSSLLFPSFHLLLTSLTPSFHFQILLTPSSPPFLTAPSLILSLFLNHPPPFSLHLQPAFLTSRRTNKQVKVE